MLEDQLLLAIVFKQHGVLVERAYFACEFDPADQVYRDRGLVFADRIKKRVLNVLCRLIVHVPISNFNMVELRYGKCSKYVQLPQSWALSRRAQVLLMEVYTPSRMVPESGRCLAKKPCNDANNSPPSRLLGCIPGAYRQWTGRC